VRDDRARQGIAPADDPHVAWTGWLDPLPRENVVADGQVVSANERRGPESSAIGTTFAPPHRARRLHELMDGRADLAPSDFETFHGDTRLPILGEVLALLDRCEPALPGRPVREAIRRWDGRMDADSPGAAAYAAWRSAFVSRLGVEPVFGPLAEPVVDDPVLAPWLDPTARIGVAVEGLITAEKPFGIYLARLAAAALDDAAGHPETWGETHVLTAVHAFEVLAPQLGAPTVPELPLSGDIDCVHVTGSQPGIGDECWRGSVARYVWDLADRQRSGWVVPLGASGDPRDPHHHDQLELWAEARLAPVVTDWELLSEEA
jgi:penicillin amidase